ncbi:hypothetical protein FZEAL_6271 [Fusarium zealandicum]|uniref:Vacuolar protein sorting-associated protein n=1 Tax=Fusarium zealandicum TaxID=1053134 RepID=A0A8H4XK18_9HYPO|nr:hypothetical protein FZEAL_6271 [Fusarium zealandicum]
MDVVDLGLFALTSCLTGWRWAMVCGGVGENGQMARFEKAMEPRPQNMLNSGFNGSLHQVIWGLDDWCGVKRCAAIAAISTGLPGFIFLPLRSAPLDLLLLLWLDRRTPQLSRQSAPKTLLLRSSPIYSNRLYPPQLHNFRPQQPIAFETMYWLRRFTILLAFLLLFSLFAWLAPRVLDPTKKGPEKVARDRSWVNSSPYFWDRQACRWIGVCGLHHLRKDPASRGNHDDDDDWGELRRRSLAWEPQEIPRQDSKRNIHHRRRILRHVPDYVTKHAPLVHLYSGEEFWPSDIRQHIEHMTAYVDDEPLNLTKWTLDNLHELNKHTGKVVLRSNDDVEDRPNWLHSHFNMPNPFPDDQEDNDHANIGTPSPKDRPELREPTTWYDVDKTRPIHRISNPRNHRILNRPPVHQKRTASHGHKPDANGYSSAPAVLVVVDKGSGIVDAFWFFFFSYNLGQTVMNIRFGNHVGDWEHCMVRFEHGTPRGVFFSEHEGGQAYAFEAVEKRGDRPVIYSAVGSHAMYALPGTHSYILPLKLLKDQTDKGPLWDPALNKYAYHYDYTKEYQEETDDLQEPQSLVPAASNPHAPTSWFHFRGQWGDEVYSLADPRQWRFFGQYHYVTGPDGPKFKALDRGKMCQRRECSISYKLDPKGTWY